MLLQISSSRPKKGAPCHCTAAGRAQLLQGEKPTNSYLNTAPGVKRAKLKGEQWQRKRWADIAIAIQEI